VLRRPIHSGTVRAQTQGETTMTHAPVRNLMLALAAVVVTSGAIAHAGAPMAKTQQPGWFRLKVGDLEVTALSDGTVELPMDQLLTNTTPDKVKKSLAAVGLTAPVETSVNAFLVNTGTKLVLIDAGSANLFGPTLGKLLVNLKASGYQPGQVDEIYITHMHPDHIGGIALNGKITFPNATVRAAKAESDFWIGQANIDKAPAAMKDFFKGANASLKPYLPNKFKPFEGADVELVPGIHAVAAPGHTPGHTIYVIESKGQKMVFWGDLIHVAAVQFVDPSVTIQFDSDPKSAPSARKKAFDDAAGGGFLVGAAHISFPGVGRLRKEGAGYEWMPVNYTSK
jgi:glyoxylase-like metal-dependent hydrolase (beta-lactamase superfamily II)